MCARTTVLEGLIAFVTFGPKAQGTVNGLAVFPGSLLAATQASSTVSAEALKWGFWHLGEFSRAYKACFGELPSDTLRRVPGGLPPDSDAG